jgi:hypothetical protein
MNTQSNQQIANYLSTSPETIELFDAWNAAVNSPPSFICAILDCLVIKISY